MAAILKILGAIADLVWMLVWMLFVFTMFTMFIMFIMLTIVLPIQVVLYMLWGNYVYYA